MKQRNNMRFIGCMLMACFSVVLVNAQQLSLAGTWAVKLDSFDNKGYKVRLPGTLDDAGIGRPVKLNEGINIATMAHLSRKVEYVGTAAYTRRVTAPASWKGKKITLTLGRAIWTSAVAIDGTEIPQHGESLVAPHEFDLTGYIVPGKTQTITLRINNGNIYPGINIEGSKYVEKESREMTHAYTNHTQIKWNGVLGEITLKARPAAHITNVGIHPDFNSKQINLRYSLNNPADAKATLLAYVTEKRSGKRWPVSVKPTSITANELQLTIPFAKDISNWSEFNPSVYQLTSVMQSSGGTDTTKVDFGLRSLTVADGNLHLNGNRIFIRGNLECVIFPKTGYPPMTEAEWAALYTKAKSYGLNSFRFHSWCPPQAAFVAADKLGFYLQVELPHWNLKVGADTAALSFLSREAHRIINEYGNHPSFLFFSMGNELEGDFGKLNALVTELKEKDKRHLYSTTTFTFQKGITGVPQPQDDFFVTQWTKQGWVRGQGVFNDKAPDFSTDYSKNANGVSIPLISHEIGQYSVYPDMKEIALYKGNLTAPNFVAVRADLQKKGLISLADDYLHASGKFATLLYKEEIEKALKTAEFDGFQLLQLQDFPGQGTALVGLLNAFWETKGVVTPAAFSRYCSPVTPLIRFNKAVYKNNETFAAKVELANFREPLKNAAVTWKIKDEAGRVFASGSFPKRTYTVGNRLDAGEIIFPLPSITEAKKLVIEVAVAGTSYINDWSIWVYPSVLPEAKQDVMVANSLSDALAALNAGRNVLLCPAPDTLNGVAGKFVPVFWSPVHFPDQPGTMGLLIKAKHKALRHFPTDTYSNWQWWDLTTKSKALKMGAMPDAANIVRPIDNFVTNENLSSVFEAKVGKGGLIFCSMDVISNLEQRPQAKQLRYSLLRYMNGADFNPSWTMSAEELKKLFK